MFVPVLVVALLGAHLFDLLSFIVMTDLHGLAAEANPVVVVLAEQVGVGGLTLAKLAGVVIGGSVFAILARQRPTLATLVVLFGIGAGVIGGLTNVATIVGA